MLQMRRSALRLAQRPYRCQWRRYADTKPPDPTNSVREPNNKPVNEPVGGRDSSGTDSVHAASAGGHEPTHHAPHPEPHNESLGRGFYASIAALALSFALYKLSRSSSSDPSAKGDLSKQPFLTRAMAYYNYWQDEYARRNTMHTKMVEQAGADRNLFQSSPWTHHIDLKFPEIFNTGSPYNIPAGHSADLGALKAHYEKKNVEAEEKRMAKLQETAGEGEVLKQRRAAEEALLADKKPVSILQRMGLQRPEQ
ncbi:MAG: hypothetical protein ALECFALPRED_005523 [Alectoria fallacina]|uniref:Uncharacterized protein n=1 Tax=Alectoria fallacina TaxID=1903189 RepID=A0A8H3ELF1_9LECA|nr:MAG: hypothetical protein ALECFALPRED_005523 [Alectoria fallacina]